MRRVPDVSDQIESYLAGQDAAKQADLREIHTQLLATYPECRLWFNDGTNEQGKVVANPTVGYGVYTIRYADGSSREFFRIGLSGNTSGMSVYVMGLDDNAYLARTYGEAIGKATVTGYCIKFRRLAVIDVDVLHAVIRDGMNR